jgi:O-acetylhomoserine (thiol)-lyase
MKTDTLGIHGGFEGDESTGASTPPIYQTVSYTYKTAQELADVFAGRAPGYIYTRIANPTTYAGRGRLYCNFERDGCDYGSCDGAIANRR